MEPGNAINNAEWYQLLILGNNSCGSMKNVLVLLLLLSQFACSHRDQFSPVRDLLIESDELLRGSSYCLSENLIPAMKRVKAYIGKKDDDGLKGYFRENGITNEKLMAEAIVRSLCSTRSIYPNRSIGDLTNKRLEPIFHLSCDATIERVKGTGTYIRR